MCHDLNKLERTGKFRLSWLCRAVCPCCLSFSQVLVHCSSDFPPTCCIDIQGLPLNPISVWLWFRSKKDVGSVTSFFTRNI